MICCGVFMNKLDGLFSGNKFIQNLEVEIKEKQEGEVKERSLPFDIIETALSNINYETVEDLTVSRDIDKRIEIANTILDPEARGRVLGEISFTLADISLAWRTIGNIGRATEVARIAVNCIDQSVKLTSTQTKEDSFLLKHSTALAKIGNIDKAIELANTFTNTFSGESNATGHDLSNNTTWKDEALFRIIEVLIANYDIEKAIKIANTIPHANTRGKALGDIYVALRTTGDLNRATEVAKTTVDSIDEAIKVANALTVDNDKGLALLKSSATLAKVGAIDMAINCANMLVTPRREISFKNIISGLLTIVNIQNVEKADEIVNAETDVNIKGVLQSHLQDILKKSKSGG